MYIVKNFDAILFPMANFLLEKKYIPCFCKIRPDKFEVSFTIDSAEEIVLSVENFELDRLEEYVPAGVGGQWWIYNDSIITIKSNINNPSILEILDLAFFDPYLGWCWAIKDGKYAEVREVDDDGNCINEAKLRYPLLK